MSIGKDGFNLLKPIRDSRFHGCPRMLLSRAYWYSKNMLNKRFSVQMRQYILRRMKWINSEFLEKMKDYQSWWILLRMTFIRAVGSSSYEEHNIQNETDNKKDISKDTFSL